MSQARWVVDLIEEGSASIEIESGATINLPAKLLPKGVKPGHVLRVTIEIDEAETKRAMDASAAQVKKASAESRKRDPGGDIVL